MPPIEPKKRERTWQERDARRLSSAARGYDHHWQQASAQYRVRHPLCVQCLLRGRLRGVVGRSGCVDHIVPIHSCPSLKWEQTNWASLCLYCHGLKTRKEPQHAWDPQLDRIVVCGLPGTGKTTFAKKMGVPYFDADEREELTTFEEIQRARGEWIMQQTSACVVIVASIITASRVAAQLRGIALHLTEKFVDRAPRALAA